MRVLITGATGFLGSHLCRQMVNQGHIVSVFTRPASEAAALKGLPVKRLLGDITDLDSVKQAVQGQEWVIHAAASVMGDETRHTQVNVAGAQHVARACREEGISRLVHVSSVATIGIANDLHHPADESFPFNLENSGLTYHLSKRQAEEQVLGEVAKGLDAVIVNPGSIKGPYGTQYRGAEIARTVQRIPVVPYFTGGICVVHVEDVVEGILAALERGVAGQRYILGGENLTFRALGQRAANALHLRRRFVPLPAVVTGLAAVALKPWSRLRGQPPWITYATHYCASRYQFYDSSRAHQALGYKPRDFDAILYECLSSTGLSRQ